MSNKVYTVEEFAVEVLPANTEGTLLAGYTGEMPQAAIHAFQESLEDAELTCGHIVFFRRDRIALGQALLDEMPDEALANMSGQLLGEIARRKGGGNAE